LKALKPEEEKSIRRFVRSRMRLLDPAHGFDHVECVVRLVLKIGRVEGANLRIAVAAAYFHDLPPKGAKSKFSYSTEDSAGEAEAFLTRLGFLKDEIGLVREAILPASYSMHLKGVLPKTLEAKVVRDADFLDAMGARGIARAFATAAYYGVKELGKVRWNLEKPVRLPPSFEGPDPTPIHHFYSKLLWLRDLMQTGMGRKLAEQRHLFMVEFLKRFRIESFGG